MTKGYGYDIDKDGQIAHSFRREKNKSIQNVHQSSLSDSFKEGYDQNKKTPVA